jgi:integrase
VVYLTREISANHRYACAPALWLGRVGPMTDNAIRQTIDRRTADAGIPHINPHRFGHTFAHKWLADVGRYGASAADERAQRNTDVEPSVDRL